MCVCVLDDEQWTGQERDGARGQVQWSSSGQEIFLISEDYFPIYFVAPGTHTHTHTPAEEEGGGLFWRFGRF